MPEIGIKGVVIIVGNYGSGKSEVAVNLAVWGKGKGMDVRIADLDLVNPYFRSREARETLTKYGIGLVMPPARYFHADLPILSPAVAGMIRSPSELTILDVGGDDAGATVLGALADATKGREMRVLQVVNPHRPFTETIEGCVRIRGEIESASRLTVNGLIGNPNLIDETTPSVIRGGYDFLRTLSETTGLPLEFLTVPSHMMPEFETEAFDCPILPVRRRLVPPWKRPSLI